MKTKQIEARFIVRCQCGKDIDVRSKHSGQRGVYDSDPLGEFLCFASKSKDNRKRLAAAKARAERAEKGN